MTAPVIRLIATDMDGTLLNCRQQISRANVEALQNAMRAGVCVALCSGRTARNAASVAYRFGLCGCALLAMNGAYLTMAVDEPPFESHEFDDLTKSALLNGLAGLGGKLVCFSPEVIVTINAQVDSGPIQYGGDDLDEYAVTQLCGVEALSRLRVINKLVYIDGDAERLKRAKRLTQSLSSVTVASSWFDNIELMPAGVNKGEAVCSLARRMGVDMAEVMTFGDYDNDLSMIERAGLGVAMANANERVKRAARYVTASNDEDGVARAIERFVLSH